ncbi:hypothetical protein KSP39_PZI010879 [Platanthera zijinensis]|uniref:Uncharacterized protein n=1 Tax=Platanthera zijinensis TaxID=2320716 RepID=A0AAP0BH08_9ASPA
MVPPGLYMEVSVSPMKHDFEQTGVRRGGRPALNEPGVLPRCNRVCGFLWSADAILVAGLLPCSSFVVGLPPCCSVLGSRPSASLLPPDFFLVGTCSVDKVLFMLWSGAIRSKA